MNNEQKKSFLILTLGCKLNQLESESINDVLIKAGYSPSSALNSRPPASGSQFLPSVIVINTCTVTSKADQKARRVIRKALRDYPQAVVIVTGCYAQLNKDDILKLETNGRRRLFVIKKDDIINLPQYLYEKNQNNNEISLHISQTEGSIPPGKSKENSLFTFNPIHFSSHTRSFLKIQDGCDKRCTYCRIRLARGSGVSLSAREVLSRLRILEQNHGEAVLTGVNICQYKDFEFFYNKPHEQTRTKENNLAELLDYLLSNTSKIAIRLSSLAQESVDEKLTEVLSHARIRPHFHLSIQSGSQKILERMGRSYNAQTIERAVTLLRGAKDDPFLACDIISGFPGETENEFEETFSLCRKMDFAWIHVFPYSKRPGTPAFSFKDTVHESDVTKRVELFTALAKKGREAYVKRWLGRDVDVLIENREHRIKNNECKFTYCYGVSDNYLKTLVRCNDDKEPMPGEVVACRLIEMSDEMDVDVKGVAVADEIR